MISEINFFGPLNKDQTKPQGQRWTFEIKCKNVEEGRIFESDEIINDDLVKKNVKNNILYYVQEGTGYESHPLFDLFFLCKHKNKDTLVMIDVTGGNSTTAEKKLKKISKWINKQNLKIMISKVLFLLLVPRWKINMIKKMSHMH